MNDALSRNMSNHPSLLNSVSYADGETFSTTSFLHDDFHLSYQDYKVSCVQLSEKGKHFAAQTISSRVHMEVDIMYTMY